MHILIFYQDYNTRWRINMLTYSFANLQGECIYMHLYKCIRQDILEGTLKAQEKLPSKRMLAKNLGISLITVENAYA